jgi:uncharacterized protein with HEPN domain
MTKDPRVYLAHILECTQKIERFTEEGRSRFFQDALVQNAVLWNCEVIGEAAKRLDAAYRTAYPQIPWHTLAGLQDVLIHQNASVELERVWAIVEGELPSLRSAIAAMLPPLDQLERELAGEDETSEGK